MVDQELLIVGQREALTAKNQTRHDVQENYRQGGGEGQNYRGKGTEQIA